MFGCGPCQPNLVECRPEESAGDAGIGVRRADGGRRVRMPDGYVQVAPGLWGLAGASVRSLSAVDFLVFDIDGVLIDASRSYPLAVEAAADWYCRTQLGLAASPVRADQLPLWKAAGGFNDDWQLAQGVCLYSAWQRSQARPPDLEGFCREVAQRGGGLDAVRSLCGEPRPWRPEWVTQVCAERYGGDEACEDLFGVRPRFTHGPGFWRLEAPLVDAAALEPWRGRLGLYTGRNDGETRLGLRTARLEGLFPVARQQTSSGAWRKPHPGGLRVLLAQAGAACGLFAGDMPDDLLTARRYRAESGAGQPPIVFVGILGGAPGAAAAERFAAGGAEWMADGANDLLAAMAAEGR